MLTTELIRVMPQAAVKCDTCGQSPAVITMTGYGEGGGICNWCSDCAMQLARKILEDLCELLTKGGRRG